MPGPPRAHAFAQSRGRWQYAFDRVWVGDVRGHAQLLEREDRLAPVNALRYQHQVRVERYDFFDAWINHAADFRLVHRRSRIIAVIRVAAAPIARPPRNPSLPPAARAPNAAADRLPPPRSPSHFIPYFQDSGTTLA